MSDFTPITMPKWGLEMTEGTLAKWHVPEGTKVAKGQVIMDIETDKIANEVEADSDGVIYRHVAQEGDTKKVGALLAVIGPEGADDAALESFVSGFKSIALGADEEEAVEEEAAPVAAAPVAEAVSEPAPLPKQPAAPAPELDSLDMTPTARRLATEIGVNLAGIDGTGRHGKINGADVEAAAKAQGIRLPSPARPPKVELAEPDNSAVNATPTALRYAQQNKIDLRGIRGTSRGRVSVADIQAHLARSGHLRAAPRKGGAATAYVNDDVRATPVAKRLADELGVDLASVRPTGAGGRITREDVESMARRIAHAAAGGSDNPHQAEKLSTMRRTIAKRLTQSKQDVPHFYLRSEIEMDALLAARKRANARDGKPKLSVNDFIIKACALALKEVPAANVQFAGDELHYFENADISVAVAIDGGLITPVVRAAEIKSVEEIAEEAKDLANRARSGDLLPEDYQGGTFSVSNLGMYGITNFDAVINPPQGGILAIGTTREEVTLKTGAPTAKQVMSVTMSCDHRAIDGAVGAQFLACFKELMEDPISLLL